MSGAPRYAVFVSPHGFGHAARTSAVMAALHRRTGAQFEIFTTVPRWFFDESLQGQYEYHEVECDVGFRQASALVADMDATVAALGRFLPFDVKLVRRLADIVQKAECRAILCDISPMGIAVAEEVGLPSLLVESFVWPWLYGPYHDRIPELVGLSAELDRWWGRATMHVQTEPLCWRDPTKPLVGPIRRESKLGRSAARSALGIGVDERVVTLTMGGVPEAMPFLDRLTDHPDTTFVVTGAEASGRDENVLRFSHQEAIFMPDLLRASDALVAKLGYGVVSEVWHEGLPYMWVTREDSRETLALQSFAEAELSGFDVGPDAFYSGDWLERVPELLGLPRRAHEGEAASEVAGMLQGLGEGG